MTNGNALAWVCWVASSLCSGQALAIRLNDYADLSGQEIERLAAVAGLVLGHAGITVNWMHCRGVAAQRDAVSPCISELRQGEIVVRIQPREPGSSDARFRTLGDSIVTVEGGQYSSVYAPAVRAQSQALGLTFDLLMGYALAHEVGHCLLGPGHSLSGLMRAAWDRKDAGGIGRLSLGLTPTEAKKAAAKLRHEFQGETSGAR